MAGIKIYINGKPKRTPVIKEDGTVKLLFENNEHVPFPKDFKTSKDSFYVVTISSKMWQQHQEKYTPDSEFFIIGEGNPSKNSKGVLFIEVICWRLELKEPEHKNKKDSSKKESPKETHSHNYITKRYDDEEVIKINTADLILTEREHLTRPAKIFIKNSLKIGLERYLKEDSPDFKPVFVRPLEDGKYSLIMGIRTYMVAKFLNLEKIPAVVREMTHQQLVEQFEINESSARVNI